jgi:16S rRNA (uracil1498-N3)-methyltransferase
MDRARVRMRTVVVSTLHTGLIELDANTSHHVRTVLRLPIGTQVKLVAPRQHQSALATVRALEPRVCVEVETVEQTLSARRDLIWLQGLPKADKADAIVQDATELGATRIVFVAMTRCVRVLDDARSEKMRARWIRIAEEAIKQCGRPDLPFIEGPLPLAEALAGVANGHRFVLYEKSKTPIREGLQQALESAAPIAFAVGPEGGITAEEVSEFERAGFITRSLGSSILRTETAAAAVLGAVRLWDG